MVDEYYIEPNLKEVLDTFRMMVRDNDTITICIDGEVRSGKSTLAIQIARYLDPSIKDDIDRVCFTTEEFEKAVLKHSKSESGKVIILDEAINMFASGDSTAKVGRKLNKLLMTCGMFNQIYILCLPSIFDLNPYVRRQHTTILISMFRREVFNKDKVEKIARGYFYFYGKAAKNNMLTWSKAKYDYSHGRSDFVGRNYGKVTMDNTFGKVYEDKKRAMIEKVLIKPEGENNDEVKDYRLEVLNRAKDIKASKKLNNNDIAYILGINVRTLYNIVNKKSESEIGNRNNTMCLADSENFSNDNKDIVNNKGDVDDSLE